MSTVEVRCPWCFEPIELWVDEDVEGTYVEDCEVCCRPWTLRTVRDEDGRPQVTVERAG